MRGYIICIGLIFSFWEAYSQEIPDEVYRYIENMVEQSVTNAEEPINAESIFSNLEELLLNPINLNSCSNTDLERLAFLNDYQIKSLIEYRKTNGKIVSLNELNYIYGFAPEIIKLVSPFVYAGPIDYPARKYQRRTYNHEIIVRGAQSSIESDSYAGNNQKYYARYKARTNTLNMALIAEKDAGEEFFTGSNKSGFDFYSGYIGYTSDKLIRQVIVGDYRILTGQGLLLWPGYATGKSSSINSIQKRGQGIAGNTSVDEHSFLRGFSCQSQLKNVTLELFASSKNIDATYDTLDKGVVIRTVRENGLHRSKSELRYENVLNEQLYGGTIKYSTNNFKLGVNMLYTYYSRQIEPENQPYKLNYFSGKVLKGYSADYKYLSEKYQLFGEIALSNNAWSYISGLNLLPHPDVSGTLVFRKFQPGYFSPYANAFSESRTAMQEQGFYAGLSWRTNWRINLSAYADIYSFPWLKYGVNGPSSGREYLIEGVWFLANDVKLIIRYKYKSAIKNYSGSKNELNIELREYYRNQYRFHFNYSIADRIKMASRLEISASGGEQIQNDPGYLIYQDVFIITNRKLKIKFRYAWFDIEDYNSRIYAYEHNARYVYSMPVYYGKGTRYNLLFQYEFNKKLSLWLRYSLTNYFDNSPMKQTGLAQIMWRV